MFCEMSLKRKCKRASKECANTMRFSNVTNSRSPIDLKSRIFIGNLNTTLVTKRHLHLVFQKHGDIKAISMHKGFAFIQYGNEVDALNAALTEDGQSIAGQTIDVNLVTEPKPHQKASPKIMKIEKSTDADKLNKSNEPVFLPAEPTLNNFENFECKTCTNGDDTKRVKFENIETTASLTPNTCIHLQRELINQCSLTPETSIVNEMQSVTDNTTKVAKEHIFADFNEGCNKRINTEIEEQVNVVSELQCKFDILICGNCRTLFTSIPVFFEHKKRNCRLRFVCRCDTDSDAHTETN